MMSTLDAHDATFLEPPHRHDPSHISHIAALPISMLNQLPLEVQDALWTLQESTSVVYASYLRLCDLLNERFERLNPQYESCQSIFINLDSVLARRTLLMWEIDSETSFFTYINALRAERSYLLEDAHPDWKHKARQTCLSRYSHLLLTPTTVSPGGSLQSKATTVGEWYARLIAAENEWIESAKGLVEPEFESTVDEYRRLSLGDESVNGGETPGSEVLSEYGDGVVRLIPAEMRTSKHSMVAQHGLRAE
jgi:hypothetical protein